MTTPVSGTAAGVPYTALAPAEETDAVIVTWHMLDAPRSPAAFAAALPLNDVPAWRIHLAMPYCGPRMVNGTMDAALDLVRADPMMSYVGGFVDQAVGEFPGALAEARSQLGVADGPVALLGGSLGGTVVLRNLAVNEVPVQAAALVNPGVRARSIVDLVEGLVGAPYEWNATSSAAADRLDFVAQAGTLADVPILLVSGERDHAALRTDAVELIAALQARGREATLVTVPSLAHPLADEPGVDPAPQWPIAKEVDQTVSTWLRRTFPRG